MVYEIRPLSLLDDLLNLDLKVGTPDKGPPFVTGVCRPPSPYLGCTSENW